MGFVIYASVENQDADGGYEGQEPHEQKLGPLLKQSELRSSAYEKGCNNVQYCGRTERV